VRIGSLFSGAAGLDRAVAAFFDGEVSWFSENDPAASAVLSHHFPGVPNLGDIEAISWSDVPPVDILCGGFPCVDVSAAGRRAGMHGTTSGLWSRMADAIDALRPRYVVIENVKGLLNANANRPVESDEDGVGGGSDGLVLRAMGAVLGDVSDIGGYEARWVTISAAAAGAPHLRERVFILAVRADADNLRSPLYCPVSGQAVNLLPTPCASDRFGAGPHGKGSMDLRTTVTSLPLSKSQVQWGKYSEAIERWERITRTAPPAVERGKIVDWRLSAEFASWMMGWPPKWVTDPEIGLTRKHQLRIVGNGVVCRQAQLALRLLARPAPFQAQKTSC
jgi:DNA (cytosine-5)-methyltransferase 1